MQTVLYESSESEIVPVERLIVLKGMIAGKEVRVLKDDGCNTNVLSSSFVRRFSHLLDVRECEIIVAHSKKKSQEVSNKVVVNAAIQIGSHAYSSNWAVVDTRYDVLLGTPWHTSELPSVDYEGPSVSVNGEELPLHEDNSAPVRIHNLGVKKFRSLLRKRKNDPDFQVFGLVPCQNTEASKQDKRCPNKRLDDVLEKYRDVFREELPDGLPPKRAIDHEIVTDPYAKPPLRPLYQLSPAEMAAAKEYITDLLRKGKIRRSRSPYGASLFFVKNKGKLRAVVDYRALNRITKRNNTPLPRSDEMFDRLGEAKVFSKMDLKVGFHQIRVRACDVEKTAFNTK